MVTNQKNVRQFNGRSLHIHDGGRLSAVNLHVNAANVTVDTLAIFEATLAGQNFRLSGKKCESLPLSYLTSSFKIICLYFCKGSVRSNRYLNVHMRCQGTHVKTAQLINRCARKSGFQQVCEHVLTLLLFHQATIQACSCQSGSNQVDTGNNCYVQAILVTSPRRN